MSRLAILGAGGHGQVLADTAEEAGWKEIVFFDQRCQELLQHDSDTWKQWSLQGTWDDFLIDYRKFDAVAIGIGDSITRLLWIAKMEELKIDLPAIVHPRSIVSRYAHIGPGTVVFAGAVIQTQARIGKGGILNTNCSVDHHCTLANGVHVCPGASLAGGVTVGDNSWVGVGSTVREMINVGSRSTIGAGAVVIRDIPDDVIAVGVPARIVKTIDPLKGSS